jgi:hypothetical protein
VLEELIVDITGWEGVLREGFAQLVRARHSLDPPPEFKVGRFSGLPVPGLAMGGVPGLDRHGGALRRDGGRLAGHRR